MTARQRDLISIGRITLQRKTVYEKYTIPKNCETLVTPLLNKEILKMSSFTPYNRSVDIELGEIQNVLVKTTALVAQLVDSVLLADKESRVMPAGDIISPILEAVMLMGNAHNMLTSKRCSNIELNKDIRTVCDVTRSQTWGTFLHRTLS